MYKNVYQENGYEDRKNYLKCLSEDFAIKYSVVKYLANMLGESEDFDGLVSALEDMEDSYGDE